MDEAFLRRLGAWFCVAAIVVYVLCTAVSMYFFTRSINPLGNWISDLGSTTFNPRGAIIYNAGVVLTGLLLVPFALSFATWHIGRTWSRNALILAEIIGLGLCLGLIMLGIYPEEAGEAHLFLAEFVYAALTLMVLLVNLALIRNVRYQLWVIPALGVFSVLLNCALIGLYVAGIKPIVVQWLSVYLALFWIFLFCYNALATRAPELMDTKHILL